MEQQRFLQPKAPWHHLHVATTSEACNDLWQLERNNKGKLAVRVVRGKKARTVPNFFDECAAALQFPFYFGENWDAFHDCATDLAWLRHDGLVVCFAEAHLLLDHASPEQVKCFVEVWQRVLEHWNQPDKGVKPKPVHLLFHTTVHDESKMLAHYKNAGIVLNKLAGS